jgi:phage shock protein PspC (stress-responsive transcriptional regulator)
MNGTSRLYRSTTDATLGGVAAGLGAYFKVDPTIVRIIFLLLAFFTGGAFVLVYVALWLLLPAAGSTAADPNQVIQENLNEMGAKFRSYTGPRAANGNPNGGSAGGESTMASNGGAPTDANANMGQAQLPQGGSATTQHRQGLNPQALIWIGAFFLLVNIGVFRAIHWGMWWPLLLIGLGVVMLSRRKP